jgi:hypothetical protein
MVLMGCLCLLVFFREINENFFNFIFLSDERQEMVDDILIKTRYFYHTDVGNIISEYLCPTFCKLLESEVS